MIRNYSDGSIIYFEKERANDVYVLRSGKVVLTYNAVDSGTEIKEDVRIGEFFGVKSALGRFPREETAQVIGKASVLVFKLNDFEALVGKNTKLLLKMMKSFSNQLRQFHSKVKEKLGDFEQSHSAPYELVNAGEVFFKNGSTDHAIYAFEKYLQQYPDGAYSNRVNELLAAAKKGAVYPSSLPELTVVNDTFENKAQTANSLQAEISQLKNAAQTGQVKEDYKTLPEQVLTAEGFLAKSDFANAIKILRSVAATKNTTSEEDKKAVEEGSYLLANAQQKNSDLDAAFVSYSAYIKNYPTGEFVKKAIFALGEIAEEKKDIAKAIALYNKVSAIPPDDEINQQAKQKISSLKG